MIWSRVLASISGEFSRSKIGLIAQLAVDLGFEDLLVVPERLAVADLEHRAGGVGQAGDRELQVDPGGRGLQVAALDVELLLEHLDVLDHVGRDRLERRRSS